MTKIIIPLIVIGLIAGWYMGLFNSIGLGSSIHQGHLCVSCEMNADDRCEINPSVNKGWSKNSDIVCWHPEGSNDIGRWVRPPSAEYSICYISTFDTDTGSTREAFGTYDGSNCFATGGDFGVKESGSKGGKITFSIPEKDPIPIDDPVPIQIVDEPALIQPVVIDGISYEEIITTQDFEDIDSVIVDGKTVQTETITDSSGRIRLVIKKDSGFTNTEMLSIMLMIIVVIAVVLFIVVGKK